MIVYDSLKFLIVSDGSLIKKIKAYLFFIELSIWINASICKDIYTMETDEKPNLSEDFKEDLIVFIQHFVADIFGF